MKNQSLLLVILLVVVLALTGCNSGNNASEEIVMDEPVPAGAEDALVVELDFTADVSIPATFTIPVGQKVLFVISNSDTVELNEDHNLVGPEIGLREIIVVPGQTVRRLWDGYDVAGEYRVGCTIHPWIDMTLIFE